MKIGFVLDDSLDKTDGVQQYVLTLGRWVHAQGHQVHYLVGHTQRTDIAHVHSLSKNIQVHFNENRMSTPLPASRRRIKELLTKEQFDVLHVQLPYSPFLAGRVLAATPASTALVGTFHILPFSKIDDAAIRLLTLLQRHTYRRFDALLSVSGPAKEYADKILRQSTTLLPNMIDLQTLRRGKINKELNDGKINIVFLGRLVERKGCLWLLRAVEHLHEDGLLRNARVLICGKGPMATTISDFIVKHHLSAVVKMVGFISEDQKPNYLAAAHLAVFPGTGGESFGIVLLEAMASGAKTVLAGNNSGYRWVMRDRNKQLFDPRNTQQFAALLKRFILDARARNASNSWQQEYIKQYDVRVVGERLLDIYDKHVALHRHKMDNTKK